MAHNFEARPGTSSIHSFGGMIRDARMALGWSQAHLGQVTGYSQTTISAIEKCYVFPNVATLQDIADALQITFVIEPG